ncbi:hypothetical protein GobsT_36850 [Gemmata obscuriglobus]|uniref:Uncharacterized protein n=2 Tax=Gemmata TaxID=113 RepID=A0A2Z3H028_9BACT|nr:MULTISPECIES: hypothetical protein [Gemmata]AWM38201.1 hypothetical protein C1280_15215 [Gemmata obscuriglobus]MDY3557697.1 hypothetical protein [Gemmata algarum]QEG28897.1 hypothetical protein GobsT_36850 [Gemmata obscuriglobus]VTS07365.1 Uncharacterized protein OS=Singulisphaera acidiphila (strain ATCC BAA-1392 / DSM 18658 / VKM B-2454 / MOB10) GN=Sinac_0896 PE=4 SV=1 [Gemmata obscuriglobus UQM 2246]
MSSSTNPESSPPVGSLPRPVPKKREIKLISHSMLFYWWPIWLLGFLFAVWTWNEDHRLAIVPPGSKVTIVEGGPQSDTTAYKISVKNPTTQSLEKARDATEKAGAEPSFRTRVSRHAWMGPLFCVVLLLTVVITNVQLRGLWSFLVLLLILVVALLITLIPDGWEKLLSTLNGLHIYINMAGYLFIATVVFILWAVSVFLFDQRTYIIVTPGQIRVCEHVGASIRTFDTTGLSFEKQRDDMFRHWLLGFFSGDLIVRTSGAEKETIRLPNVLWIGWRLEEVQQLLAEKATVAA